MTIRFRPRATADVYELLDVIAEHRPRSAEVFARRVQETCGLLERFPLLGRLVPVDELAALGMRAYPVPRFLNHLILNVPLADGVEVVRVVDGRRDLAELFDDPG